MIPVGESRRLRDEFAPTGRVRYTEFNAFKHLDPTKGKPSPIALARELVRFGRAIYPLFEGIVIPARCVQAISPARYAVTGTNGWRARVQPPAAGQQEHTDT